MTQLKKLLQDRITKYNEISNDIEKYVGAAHPTNDANNNEPTLSSLIQKHEQLKDIMKVW